MRPASLSTAFCALLLGTAECAPVSSQQPRQGSSWMDAWSGPIFTGFHKRYEVPHNQCVDIRADFPPGTDGGLSSVRNGPHGTTECTLFAFPDCHVRPDFDNDWGDRLGSGGVHDSLDDPEMGWGNKAQAIKCFPIKPKCSDCSAPSA